MCGLAGVATTERRKDEMARKDAFRQLLEAASWRGKDATGVACVRLNALKEPAIVYKKAIKASDFIDLDHYRRLERNFDEYGYVIGHARSSTSDGWNLSDNNAHPFQVGPITLVHNGTIRNARAIGSGVEHPVDSAHVAAALSDQEPIKLLEKLEGPFALVWHDARDGSLNFAKNNEKPLFWCYVERENTMFWGSELEAIYAILYRHDINIEGKFRLCTSYNHFKFTDVNNLRKFERTPFGKPRSPSDTRSLRHGGAWIEETRRLGHDGIHRGTSDSTPQQEKSTKETSMDTTSGSPTGTDVTGIGSEGVFSVRPTSRRKLRATQERLLKLGRKIDSPICFVPEFWATYKNQRNNRGSITGHDKVRKQKFQIGHVTKDVWELALQYGKIYGRIANVKRDDHDLANESRAIIVCDYSPELMKRFLLKPNGVKASPEVLDTGRPFPDSVESIDTVVDAVHAAITAPRPYIGPGNRKYTEKEYLQLVKHGCGYCSRDLSPENHEEILWVGPQEQTPICWVCSGNAEVKLSLGMRDEV